MATPQYIKSPRPAWSARVTNPARASALADLAIMGERAFVFIAALFLSGTIIFLIVGNVESEATVSNPVARLSWYPIYLGILIGAGFHAHRLFANAHRLSPIIILMLFTAASIAWSVDPALTQRRVIALWATVIFGIYLAFRGDFLETLKILAAAWFIVALVNLLVVLANPALGIDQVIHVGAWKGISVEKNQLGGQMARANALFGAVIFLGGRWKGVWGAGFVLTAMLVLGSTSKTALIAMVVPWSMIGAFWIARKSPVTALIVTYACVLAGAMVFSALVIAPDTVADMIGRDLTFTGRTGIWEASLHSIDKVPTTGYGQGAFWSDELGPSYDIRTAVDWEVPSAHNAWLEVGLSLGYPGMVIIIGLTLLGLILGSLKLLREADPWPLIFLVQIVFFSISESILWQQNTFVSAWYVFILAHLYMRRRPAKVKAAKQPLPVYRRTV